MTSISYLPRGSVLHVLHILVDEFVTQYNKKVNGDSRGQDIDSISTIE